MNMDIFWPAAVSLFVRAIPAHLMACWPFRDRLRFPLWAALMPVVLIQIGQSLLYGYAAAQTGAGRVMEYGFALVYMAIYFFSVRDNRTKVLFLYLFVTDYVLILRGASVFLEARFFYHPGMNFDSWTSILFNLAALAVSAPFMLRLFSEAREKVFGVDAPGFWRTAWMVPAFTTVIVMIFTFDFDADNARTFSFLLARTLLLLCVLVVYSILLNALDGIRRQAALTEQAAVQEQFLNLQRTQYEQLLQHNGEMKAARHDLRQHLEVMRAYLEKKDTDGALAYLDAYAQKLPADIHRTFARNFALNVVCTSYAEKARQYEIDYDVALDVPERLSISEPEVCALLGNLLKNAVEACREARCSAPFIRVRGTCEDGHIVITVDNTCEQEPVWENDRILSTKHEGYGIGTWAVRVAAERTGGTVDFSYKDGVFYASVFLYE